MFAILIAIILLAGAVGAIYLLLKNMGEDGIEAAAPGSCKSGRCGVRRPAAIAGMTDQQDEAPDNSKPRHRDAA